ncbi:MAG: Methyltransferase type 11 [Candidatus Moranbacteria bacterium GW2011_GWE1_36_7]|nr:MAG: Methyltransferase type 11 [Candidatus Moranbacteria bacterium GW2011_GWD2_36_12]KKQ07170.1 MAG: Methyltransferase type 11 [Candidatus Moranbacteria bacterium GW2011_GWE2_36_40]KKQ15458.1 MAG: Methyltransferase type 11 [Candidatus Moranbacteria bacterium GW2011_GWE1_36_7]
MEESKNITGKFLDPDAIISQLGVEFGSVVADFGCGPGYFSIPFAKKIGADGKLYALDILPQALETVVAKAKSLGFVNIITTRANLEKEHGSKLEDNSVDWIVLKDILFQNQKKDIILKEAFRILKVGGKIIVIEWKKDDSPVGPEKEIRISQEDLERLFAQQKFVIEKNIEAGDYHYAFVAVK